MKAKFLRRIENEKDGKVKIVLECESREVYQFEKGETYEVSLCEAKLPNMAQHPKELLRQAQSLISQATDGMGDAVMVVRTPSREKKSEKCGNCCYWLKRTQAAFTGVPRGGCILNVPEETPIYHWCSFWRDHAEEDKV